MTYSGNPIFLGFPSFIEIKESNFKLKPFRCAFLCLGQHKTGHDSSEIVGAAGSESRNLNLIVGFMFQAPWLFPY